VTFPTLDKARKEGTHEEAYSTRAREVNPRFVHQRGG